MAIKIAINGYGRIGRNILRALFEAERNKEFDVVAINDLGNAETNAHLTKYDTAHGRFPGEVKVEGEEMIVNGDRIKVFAERDPAKLPWGELGVNVPASLLQKKKPVPTLTVVQRKWLSRHLVVLMLMQPLSMASMKVR